MLNNSEQNYHNKIIHSWSQSKLIIICPMFNFLCLSQIQSIACFLTSRMGQRQIVYVKNKTIWLVPYQIFDFFKHCIRERYVHCKGQTIKSIIKKITDYLQYHKTSYSVYETFKYDKGGFLHTEFAKFISMGNYVRIGKVFQIPILWYLWVPCLILIRDSFEDFLANDYNNIFGPEYVEIFDGQEIMSDPQNEYGLLLDFFGLERFELEWTFNKEKGFHCLSYPVNYCLGKKWVIVISKIIES